MTDARVQLEVEDWVRRNWMPKEYGMSFQRNRLRLRSGGVFDFDAVSADRTIAATISTSSAKTSGSKHAVGKIQKLRSDMLFLTMVEAQRRIIVLTERVMYEQYLREKQGGRVPPEIEFANAELPGRTGSTSSSRREKDSYWPYKHFIIRWIDFLVG